MASRSPPAAGSCWSPAPRTATSASSPTPTGSTSPAAASGTWASARASTAAWARRWPASKRGSRWRRRCPCWATTSWPGRRPSTPARPTCTSGRSCRSPFPVAPGRRRPGQRDRRTIPRTSRPCSTGRRRVTLVTTEFEADVRVAAKREAADGVVTLSLRDVERPPAAAWEPGAHVDLILDQAPTRQYSLCGDPDDHHPRVSQFLSIMSRRRPRLRGPPGFLAVSPAQGMDPEISRRR